MPTMRERGSGEEWEQPTWKTAMAVPRVREDVEGKALAAAQPEEVEWVEADELWTYASKKTARRLDVQLPRGQ